MWLLQRPTLLVPTPQTKEQGLQSIKSDIEELYNSRLHGVASGMKLSPPSSSAEIHAKPIILLVGAHSSGKSSFANHLIGRPIQVASKAPQDDKFTVFLFGKTQTSHQGFVEQSGEGLALDQNLPFREDLSSIGSPFTNLLAESLSSIRGKNFLHRVAVKHVEEKSLEDVLLVDSPGMLDGFGGTRDYDYQQAVMWFAERADQVLFFFDPDQPGTSAEAMIIFQQVSSFQPSFQTLASHSPPSWHLNSITRSPLS
jgi:hypothetical protein